MESASVIKNMKIGLTTTREEEHSVDQQLKGISLFLGGARSGKSTYAQQLAEQSRQKITYLATAEATDNEMEMRINAHKASRSALWETWEGEPRQLPGIIAQTEGVLLLDCLTLWLTRLFLHAPESEADEEKTWILCQEGIFKQVEALLLPGSYRHLIIVSNEVGLSLVPPNRMGRRFRDLQGKANQMVAARADRVALFVAGIPLWIKGSS